MTELSKTSSLGFADTQQPLGPSDRGRTRTGGWMRDGRLHRLYGRSRRFRRLAMGLTAWFELALLGGHKEHKTIDLIRRVRRERESLLIGNEAFFLHSLASAQSALDGDMAEFGVYEGCSAKIISAAAPDKRLHLFDTFAGLPEPDDCERDLLRSGQYASSLDAVRAYLGALPRVAFHQGSFPASAMTCTADRFCFVHLDVDLRDSTRACLDFFYPRMAAGGVILTHDYSYLEGVKTAFDQFFASRPENIIELPTSQAMVIKGKS